jgi:hypothetical protein
MLRITYYLDSRLRDGIEVVSLTHRSRTFPQRHFRLFQYPKLSKLQGIVRMKGLCKLIKFIYLVWVLNPRPSGLLHKPQPLRYPMSPLF